MRFRSVRQVGFSKLTARIVRIEKKWAVIDVKISKSRPSELDFENPPPGSLGNSAIFSITAFALQ